VCVTGAPPSADWNLIVNVTGTPFLCLAAFLRAFRPAAVGVIANATGPAAATAFEPFPNATFAGRHLPLSLILPTLHFAERDANTPNLPFGNVADQRKLPRLATVTLTVIAPVFVLKLACPAKPLSGVGLGFGAGAGSLGGSGVGPATGGAGAAATANDWVTVGAA